MPRMGRVFRWQTTWASNRVSLQAGARPRSQSVSRSLTLLLFIWGKRKRRRRSRNASRRRPSLASTARSRCWTRSRDAACLLPYYFMWHGCGHLDHRQPPARGGKGVAFSCVSFLANAQGVDIRLEAAASDDGGRCQFIFHDGFLVLSPIVVSLLGCAFEYSFSSVGNPHSLRVRLGTRTRRCRTVPPLERLSLLAPLGRVLPNVLTSVRV
jgi:hypothetical protein